MTTTTAQTTLQWGAPLPETGAWLRGYFQSPWGFEETVARLIAASGQPAQSPDGYKVSVEFHGTFHGVYFALYDYKGDRALHIGGNDTLDVDGLQAVLVLALRVVQPVPYYAREPYDTGEPDAGHGWQLRREPLTLDACDWPLIVNRGEAVVATFGLPKDSTGDDEAGREQLALANLVVQLVNEREARS